MQQKHWWLYVLKLEHDKWYVGITTKDVRIRFEEHRANVRAAAWTRRHLPIEIVETLDLGHLTEYEAIEIESQKTLELMKVQGVNNVRGGRYNQLEDYVVFMHRIFTKEGWLGVKTALQLVGIILAIIAIYVADKYMAK